MAKKLGKLSLRDIKMADEVLNIAVEEAPAAPAIIAKEKTNDKVADVNEGDYEKLSVSIPIETFETLQDISRERRRAKKKHTMSQMVREALTMWLEHRNQTNSI